MAYRTHFLKLDPRLALFMRDKEYSELQPDGELMVDMVEDDPRRLTTWAQEYVDMCRFAKVDEYKMLQNTIGQLTNLVRAAKNSKQTADMSQLEVYTIIQCRNRVVEDKDGPAILNVLNQWRQYKPRRGILIAPTTQHKIDTELKNKWLAELLFYFVDLAKGIP